MHLKTISTEQAMRYSRHISLSDFDLDKQEVLINSKAIIVGVGGLGCSTAQYLAASGIGQLTLVDNDIVEITNLQRQILHFENAVGQKKVQSAKDALQLINSGVEVLTIDERLSEAALLSLAGEHDLIIDCSDNLETRNLLNRVCYASGTALVSGAAIRMEGQLFCVVPAKHSACYACISHLFGEQNLSCVESGVLSPLVGAIGSMQAIEAIKILTDFGELAINKLQVYDAKVSTWTTFSVNKRPDCKICSE